MMKKLLLLSLIITSCFAGYASDSLNVSRKNLVGPPALVLPPPVDSAVLRKMIVIERLKKRGTEQNTLRNRKTQLRLNELLLKTETAGNPDPEVINSLEESLAGYQRSGDIKNQALIFSTYGVYYGKFGQPEKSIHYFEEALRLKQRLSDKAGVASIAENLANLYKLNGQTSEAIKYFDKAASANLGLNKTSFAAYNYLQLAALKYSDGRFKESETYILRKAFPLFRRTGNKYGRMKCFQNLADLYFEQARYTESKWFYLQAQLMAQKLFDNEGMITSIIGLAKVRNASAEYQEALQLYKQAEQLALSHNHIANLVEINGSLGEVYNHLGNYPAAASALDQYNKFKDNWLQTTKL